MGDNYTTMIGSVFWAIPGAIGSFMIAMTVSDFDDLLLQLGGISFLVAATFLYSGACA